MAKRLHENALAKVHAHAPIVTMSHRWMNREILNVTLEYSHHLMLRDLLEASKAPETRCDRSAIRAHSLSHCFLSRRIMAHSSATSSGALRMTSEQWSSWIWGTRRDDKRGKQEEEAAQ